MPLWYSTLSKPSFNPPNYLFGPVWTTLYILMGISFYLVYQASQRKKGKVIFIFITQLVLNFFWSIIFFAWQQPGFAAIEIIAMWLSIAYMIYVYYPIHKVASLLQIPYLLWVSFATVLNISIFLLN
ncbi:MAG: tryptophan-rich sensory protein [Sphingobacteriaceae bacterium]|nr:tryptophan-rich sensory protein [Sphingobacteriaceae bacterium]